MDARFGVFVSFGTPGTLYIQLARSGFANEVATSAMVQQSTMVVVIEAMHGKRGGAWTRRGQVPWRALNGLNWLPQG